MKIYIMVAKTGGHDTVGGFVPHMSITVGVKHFRLIYYYDADLLEHMVDRSESWYKHDKKERKQKTSKLLLSSRARNT